MARKILNLTGIEFAPLTGTLKLPQLVRREKLLLITKTTANKIVYNFADPALGLYSFNLDTDTDQSHGSTTLVLKYNTANMLPTDNFQIVYDENNEIYKQYNLYEIRDQFNELLYEVRQDRGANIDYTKNFTTITG